MEVSKIYENTVFLLANLIRNERLKVELLNDLDFKKQTIELVNDLLFLEIDENCTFKDQKWGAFFGKTIVNITKEKIKFEKPDKRTNDELLSDVTFIQSYCFNNFQISRDTLTTQDFELTESFIKENSKITDELKEKYSKQEAKHQDEAEVVDKSSEQPNINEQFIGGFGANQQRQNQNGPHQQGPNSNPYINNNLPRNPFQDMRFYPYTSKPKYTKWLKLALASTMFATVIFFLIVTLLFQFSYYVIPSNLNEVIGGFDSSFITAWATFKASSTAQSKWSLGNFVGGTTTNIWMGIIMLALIMSFIYTLVQPPRTYIQKFVIPGFNLIIPFVFVIFIFFSFWNSFSFMFGSDPLNTILGNYLAVNISNVSTQEGLDQWYNLNTTGLNNLMDSMGSFFNLTTARVLLIFLFIFTISTTVSLVFVLALNPKADKEKRRRAMMEYNVLMQEAMQGRKYEMDPSLFEPQEEIDAFIEELKNRGTHKQKDKKNDEDDKN